MAATSATLAALDEEAVLPNGGRNFARFAAVFEASMVLSGGAVLVILLLFPALFLTMPFVRAVMTVSIGESRDVWWIGRLGGSRLLWSRRRGILKLRKLFLQGGNFPRQIILCSAIYWSWLDCCYGPTLSLTSRLCLVLACCLSPDGGCQDVFRRSCARFHEELSCILADSHEEALDDVPRVDTVV